MYKRQTITAVTIATLGLAPAALAVDEPPACVDDCEPDPPRQKGNNGLGNGDQTAPGNSLGNNKAENQVGNPGHNSGKAQNSN